MASTQADRRPARGYIIAVAIVLVLMAASWAALRDKRESVVYAKPLMGTVVQITLMDGDWDRFDEAAEAAFNEISRLEEMFSSYKTGSDVARINKAAGKAAVDVAPEVIEVVRKALLVSALSGGAFDPTVGALSKAWGPSGEKGEVPPQAEIKKLLEFVDHKSVVVDEHGRWVRLKKEGMALNLGGVAKGFLVEKAALELKRHGTSRAIIHAGGDMLVFGAPEDEPFKIGIQHPREKKLLGEALLRDGAVASSGDYERFFEKDGVRYHHILDPKTGFPARGARAVTLIAKDPTVADALSTAVFVLGPDRGMALIEGLEDVEGVVVDAEGKVAVSKGFEGSIY